MTTLAVNVDDPVTLLVDGTSRPSASEESVDVIDPSSGLRRLVIPAGCDADVEIAVRSSRLAFDDGRWVDLAPSQKKRALHRLADLIDADAQCLDTLDAGEMGKPVSESAFNATSAADLVRFYAEALDKVAGDVFPSDRKSFVAQRRVARGVVAAIVPWNFPTYVAALKFAPALAAGNSVIVKPSELSSRSAIRMAHLALKAGLPPGALNVLPGLGSIVGKALALHSDVDMITFTGSTNVGKLVQQYAGQSNLKPLLAECGGKSPQIVFADGVDLDVAGDSIARFILTNQGQICSVGSRLLVEKIIEQALIDRITARFRDIVIGNALDPKTTFGPVVSAKQCARVMQYVEIAQAEGADIAAGGHRALPDSGGYFIEPTVLRNVAPTDRVAKEEIFGPVLSVIPFETEEEAIQIANGTTYGLAAYVWTANLATGMKMARGIRSSVVINAVVPSGEGAGHAGSYEPSSQSGFGVEGGLAGMESYMRRKTVEINFA